MRCSFEEYQYNVYMSNPHNLVFYVIYPIFLFYSNNKIFQMFVCKSFNNDVWYKRLNYGKKKSYKEFSKRKKKYN